MSYVAVIRLPELGQLGPSTGVVVLHGNPVILNVTWKLKCIALLRADEPLMVVGGRIDQMANHLLGGPLAGGSRDTGLDIGHRPQRGTRCVKDLQQIVRDGGEPDLV
jgi:hypothetical protein